MDEDVPFAMIVPLLNDALPVHQWVEFVCSTQQDILNSYAAVLVGSSDRDAN
jgi:hypothetical protein